MPNGNEPGSYGSDNEFRNYKTGTWKMATIPDIYTEVHI